MTGVEKCGVRMLGMLAAQVLERLKWLKWLNWFDRFRDSLDSLHLLKRLASIRFEPPKIATAKDASREVSVDKVG